MAAKKNRLRPEPRSETNQNKWVVLAMAIVMQAIREAKQKRDSALRDSARAWLVEEGQAWLELLGVNIDQKTIEGWVNAGCPDFGQSAPGDHAV